MDYWYKKLNYYKNPFSLDAFNDESAWLGDTQLIHDLIYYVKSGSIIFIESEKGLGKTRILMELVKHFRGKVIFVDAKKLLKTLNIEELLQKRLSLPERVLKKNPIDQIVMLDNVEELSKVNYERLKYYYDQGFIQSIVFTGLNFKETSLPESILSRIGSRVFSLEPLSLDNAIKLVSNRLREDIDDDSVISLSAIKKIYALSKKNYALFLLNLNRVFLEMVRDGSSSVNDSHISILKKPVSDDELLSLDSEFKSFISDEDLTSSKETSRIVKVGDYYRNLDEDMFCSNCGAIVQEEDVVCPECGVEFE
jgi:hypothetical protein